MRLETAVGLLREGYNVRRNDWEDSTRYMVLARENDACALVQHGTDPKSWANPNHAYIRRAYIEAEDFDAEWEIYQPDTATHRR